MPLFDTTEDQLDIKQYVPAINRNLSSRTVEPFIQLALLQDVKPYIGAIATPENDDFAEYPASLLLHLRRTVAWFTYFRMLSNMRITMADLGIQQQMDREGTSQPSTDSQYNDSKWSALRTAYDELELLIWGELYPNRNEAGTYSTWWNGNKSHLTYDLMLNSPGVFQEHHPLQTPGASETYLKLRPIMLRIERYHLLPILCKDLLAELREQVKTDALSTTNTALLPYIRDFIAAMTIRKGIAELGLQMGPNGAKITTSKAQSSKKRMSGDWNSNEQLFQADLQMEDMALKCLKDFLSEKADDYPLWRDSKCNPNYTDPESEEQQTQTCTDTSDDYKVITAKGGIVSF